MCADCQREMIAGMASERVIALAARPSLAWAERSTTSQRGQMRRSTRIGDPGTVAYGSGIDRSLGASARGDHGDRWPRGEIP
jgi:hypothetical protein